MMKYLPANLAITKPIRKLITTITIAAALSTQAAVTAENPPPAVAADKTDLNDAALRTTIAALQLPARTPVYLVAVAGSASADSSITVTTPPIEYKGKGSVVIKTDLPSVLILYSHRPVHWRYNGDPTAVIIYNHAGASSVDTIAQNDLPRLTWAAEQDILSGLGDEEHRHYIKDLTGLELVRSSIENIEVDKIELKQKTFRRGLIHYCHEDI